MGTFVYTAGSPKQYGASGARGAAEVGRVARWPCEHLTHLPCPPPPTTKKAHAARQLKGRKKEKRKKKKKKEVELKPHAVKLSDMKHELKPR